MIPGKNYIKQMSIPGTWHQFISYVHFPLLVLSFQSDLLAITFCLSGQLLSPFHLTGTPVQGHLYSSIIGPEHNPSVVKI